MATDPETRTSDVICLAESIAEPRYEPNRRSDMRLRPSDVRWLRGARLKYGRDVRVLDISAGGIRVESETQLLPQSNVVFELSGPDNSILMPAKVLRSLATPAGRGTLYQGACQFKRSLTVPELVKSATHIPPRQDAASTPRPAAWRKVIARLLDGRVLRGYTTDFHPSKPLLHLFTEPHVNDNVRLSVTELEALFFVRELAENPHDVEPHDLVPAPQGRKVIVTFRDGRTLRGSTLGYRGEGTSFFVQPADATSNTLSVFVVPGATQVRFL